MKKVIRNPITLLIFFTLILHVAIPLLLDTANKQLSTYIPIKEGYVNVSSIPEKKIGILRFSPSQDIAFTILGEEDLQISFMYKEGKVPFNYYIDGVKYENSNNLTHRPKVLTYENSPIHVKIFSKGSTIKSNGDRMVFIGRAEDIEYFNFLKITYSTVMMTINAMLLIGSLVIFWKFKTRYMLILLLISIVSIIKIFVDAGLLFSITTSILALFLFETSSGIFLFFLSQFLFYSIFHIHFQRKYIIMYMFLSISLEISYLLNHYLPLLLFSHLISIIAIMYMATEACKHKRKWITLLTLSYMGYSATVVYRFCITLGIFERGYFSTLIFSPQLGFVLFIGIALFTVIATYAHRVHVLEIEKKKNMKGLRCYRELAMI